MSSLNPENGRSPENTPGAEGQQEEQGQDNLQLQARAPDGGAARETRNYIIYIENSSKYVRPFIVNEVSTAEELFQKVCDYTSCPSDESIGLRVSDTRMGAMNRVFYENRLPLQTDTLYVSLYLKRHPPLSFRKFEQ